MSSSEKPKKRFGKGLYHSFNVALDGIVHTLRSERNMRLHFLIGFFVLILGVYLNFSTIEFMMLCIAVAFVLVAEMFNTAVEHAVDLIEEKYHPIAGIIKDIAAGAVFVSAVNAAIVGYLLFFKHVDWAAGPILAERMKHSPWHITLIALIIVIGLVLLIKVFRHEKALLRGGMPSGHSAVAFSVWVIVSLVTGNVIVSILVFFLALIIARSRITTSVHDLWQVLVGGLLGALITLFVFQLLSQ